MQFSAADWNSDTCALIHLDGSDSTLRGNLLCISLSTPLSTPTIPHLFLWLSLLFFPTSLSVGSYFILLSLSVPLSLSSLVPASKIFQWLESNLLRGRRRHRANANSVFLSESVWGCVSNRYENINQVRHSKKCRAGLCLAVTTVHFIQIRG